MKKVFGDYYLGLDIGTNSVGWAVTDMDYNLMRFNGKDMWGIRLFQSGETAETRRMKRSARRRLDRSRERIRLLQSFFAEEINAIDPAFFQRLEDSKFYPDDKTVHQKNTLFNDKNYQDKDYHKEFPTIYHLREALISDTERKFDARLVYLAIAHILSHRGHFHYRGTSVTEIPSFEQLYASLAASLADHADRNIGLDKADTLEEIMVLPEKITAKSKLIEEIIGRENKPVATLLAGGSVQLSVLFQEDLLKGEEIKSITLVGDKIEENRDALQQLLEERFVVLEDAKAIFDSAELTRIMQSDNLSKDKIKSYEKHKEDLKILKNAIWLTAGKKAYKAFFNDLNAHANYPAYIGKSLKKANASVCSQEEFYKVVKEILKNSSAPGIDYIVQEIEKGVFLPKQRTSENSVIPYQLHLDELKRILQNAVTYLPFLKEKDEEGCSVQDKIETLLTFRIPYYVGPLNAAHSENGNAWIVKKSDKAVRPWNFVNVVDRDASQTAFIRRMTNKCSYLIGADVLPKQSILYSKYMVLNELNNLRVDGEKLPVSIKQAIFNDLFLKTKKVTLKRIRDYLVSNGYTDKDTPITGLADDIKSSMASYIDIERIIGDKVEDTDFVDQMITLAVIFGQEKAPLENRFNKQFGDRLTKEQARKLANISYSGWGRFSAELLEDIYHTRKDTGEMVNIISMMWETNENFMQLMTADKYDYVDQIRKYNEKQQDGSGAFTYDSMVDPLYCSPAVKRSIWQALKIIDELQGILGQEPKRVFVEVTRGDEEKKTTVSRKKLLSDLYAKCKKEAPDIAEKLKTHSEGELRSKMLFLYYKQMGRCMYSGDPIDLELINNSDYYDIDHVYPRSLTKDNSQHNLVLVKKQLNRIKGIGLVPDSFKSDKTVQLWQMLKDKKLISSELFHRLTRRTPLTEEELAGFINRQLVETSQSSKAVAEVLQKYYEQAEIIYVKNGHVADFRHENNLIKVREVNDHHHAKDAFLNIVVGNVYHTKFTKSPRNFIRELRKTNSDYSLRTLFKYNVKRGSTTAWIADGNKTLNQVFSVMEKDSIQFTRLAFEEKGAFYDEMPMKKGRGQIPLKSSDPRLHNVDRYGAYNKDTGAYFILVEHLKKKKRIRTIEYVPIRIAATIKNEEQLVEYCQASPPYGLGLEETRILIGKIKIDTLFKINGFPAYITSRTGDSLVFKAGIQLIVPKELLPNFKKIAKFVARKKASKHELTISDRDEIDENITLSCYDLLTEKATETIWSKRPNVQGKRLKEGREKFVKLSLEKQCEVVMNVLNIFSASRSGSGGTDLTGIGGSKQAATLIRSKDFTNDLSSQIIHQSITGLFASVQEI